ncbi:MAG: hypothetical protein HYU55_01550 [Nocardioides sp.]|nr:hypothetical protein [Nocardioides sp.]
MRSTCFARLTSHTRWRLWLNTIRLPCPVPGGRAVSSVSSGSTTAPLAPGRSVVEDSAVEESVLEESVVGVPASGSTDIDGTGSAAFSIAAEESCGSPTAEGSTPVPPSTAITVTESEDPSAASRP